MNNTPKSHAQFVPFSREKNRAAVVIPKDLSRSTMMLGSLCDGDTVTVRSKINKNQSIVFSSMYMDITKQVPENMVTKIAAYAEQESLPLILGIDSNAHNTAWGHRDNNARGNTLLQAIGTNGLVICNTGNRPTFTGSRGTSIIDLTLVIMEQSTSKILKFIHSTGRFPRENLFIDPYADN